MGTEALLIVAGAENDSVGVFCSEGVVRTSDTFVDGMEPRLTGAWTVIPSGGELSSDGRVITT